MTVIMIEFPAIPIDMSTICCDTARAEDKAAAVAEHKQGAWTRVKSTMQDLNKVSWNHGHL